MKRLFIFIFVVLGLLITISCKEKEETLTETNTEVFNNWYEVRAEDYALFFDEGGNPSVIDYETMETAILCNVPNCTHTTSSCINLCLKESSQLPVIYNDCAYFFVNSESLAEKDGKQVLELKVIIRKYDFNDINYENVAVIEGFNANDSGGCYLIGSEYYFTTNNGNPEYDDLGNVESYSSSGGGNLFSINLDNGKVTDYGEVFDYELLKNEYPSVRNSLTMYLMGKIDNKLYIGVNYTKTSITPEMLQNGETPIWSGETYIFDINSHKIDKLDDEFSMCTMNDYHSYFANNQNKVLTLQNVKTGEIFNGPDIVSWNAMTIFDDKVWHDDSKCFDIKSGKDIEVSSNRGAIAIGIYKNNYIIKGEDSDGNIVFEKIPCEEIDSLFE